VESYSRYAGGKLHGAGLFGDDDGARRGFEGGQGPLRRFVDLDPGMLGWVFLVVGAGAVELAVAEDSRRPAISGGRSQATLWAMKREAPAARAASTRFFVPTSRIRAFDSRRSGIWAASSGRSVS
jgi:hypothetical protein